MKRAIPFGTPTRCSSKSADVLSTVSVPAACAGEAGTSHAAVPSTAIATKPAQRLCRRTNPPDSPPIRTPMLCPFDGEITQVEPIGAQPYDTNEADELAEHAPRASIALERPELLALGAMGHALHHAG